MTWFDSVQKISTAVAALVAAWVAFAGLRAWRVQLLGRAEYELARRVLRAAFNVRDKIAQVRNPFVPVGEVIEAYKEAGLDPDAVDISKEPQRKDQLVYQRRWQPLASALSDLSLEMLEAEVLWGADIRKAEALIRSCVGELNAALFLYFRDIHTVHSHGADKAAERIEKQFAIVYADGPDNPFTGKVNESILVFENTFRPYLRLGHVSRAGQAA